MPDNKNALPLGTILNNRYEIERLVGGGSFGLVYRTKHIYLNSIVAIKELFPGDIVVRQDKAVHPTSDDKVALYQKVLSSFRKEGQRLACLENCPSIVRCHDYFEENGTGYLVMEYVEGKSLRELVRTYRKAGKSFSEDALISLVRELLAGLKEVHKAGIQHMDIKPENIYLRQTEASGELNSPVLLDFGAARSQTGHSTGSSLLVGTVPYAPLEQMREGGVIGPSTDIYALGITLYELVFEEANIPGSIERLAEFHSKGMDPLEAAKSKSRSGYSEKFLELIDKSIKIKAEDRPQSVEELEEKLSLKSEQKLRESNERFRVSKTVRQPFTFKESYKRMATLISILILLVIVGGYIYISKPDTDKVSDPRSEEIEHHPKSGNKEEIPKQVGDTFRDCATCPEMVVVPSGSFMMGSLAEELGRKDREGPQHRVTISKPFAVGKYEVTRGQYEEFANETRHPNNEWRNPKLFEQSANHPVVKVSREDAKAYTEWLSTKTGQNYRLLSEAEWEYVARAGTTAAYHFGATISRSQANYWYDGREIHNDGGTVEVGSYFANAFGLHDMHGNVWEWVEDCWHDDYNGAPSDGRAWIINCNEDLRVLRGGSWFDDPRQLRSAYRGWNHIAWDRTYGKGFRIARALTTKVGDISSEEIKHLPKSENKEETPKQAGDTFRDCTICPEMVVVPSGSFMMGSPGSERGRSNNEGPQHRVTILKPFAVGKYEVTVGQFEKFVNETKHPNNEWREPGFKQFANHPIANVSWEYAQDYTEWLSTKTGQNYRLLSEAEWEYVARAGTTKAYHFGVTISPTQANYDEFNSGTVEVGSYPANAFGLHDVHGNVHEWVEDCWHGNYNGAPSDGRAWTINCDADWHMLRGGSWFNDAKDLRSASRFVYLATSRINNYGFRIARTLTTKVGDISSEEIEHLPKFENKEETPKQVDTFRDCATCPEMVVVPSGSFMMGSPTSEQGIDDREGPQHRVTISKPFAVGKYEVTRSQFAMFIDAGKYEIANECFSATGEVNWHKPSFTQTDTHPVVCISWNDAKAYINWLSRKTGQNYRLLSEAEWEYVARAGTTKAYHFGATISPTQANYWYEGREFPNDDGTVEVGSYPENAFGLHDMHGNVWEWVEDCWHNNYNGAPSDGSAWTSDCRFDNFDVRVLRGGSWLYEPRVLRSAVRLGIGTSARSDFSFGFRIARTLTTKVGDISSEEIEHSPKSENKKETSKQVGDTFRDCATCPEMVVVPSGSFMMGSPTSEQGIDDREGPQHRVTISKPFAVGKYEVTRSQFAMFIDAEKYEIANECFSATGEVNWHKPGFTQTDTHPVVCVSWNDAKAYINWLSRKTGQNYRLLSEAEWEYVARAGTTTAYHFGATISPNQANYWYDDREFPNDGGTVEVGSYPVNAFGLHDMHGNVWEWVEDCWHNNYNDAPSDGSAWTINCALGPQYLVLRGGSWVNLPGNLRSAVRIRFDARYRLISFGFRIARDLTP